MATVAELSYEMFGVRPELAAPRFDEDGWIYEETVSSRCPGCAGELHVMGKPYTSGGREYRYAAFLCPHCAKTFTLQDLGYKTRKALSRPPKPKAGSGPSVPGGGTDSLEEMPTIPTDVGIASVKEWTSFEDDLALQAMNRILIRWGGMPLSEQAIRRGEVPGGGSYAALVTSGKSGSIATLVVEHQRTRWACYSSETRIVRPRNEQPVLHVVTVECEQHPVGTDRISAAGEIARESGLKVFGVDPFRVGNTTAQTVARLVEMLTSPDRGVPIVLLSGANRAPEAEGLVARLGGAALVATIDGDASWALSDSLGPALGCYAGAVRVYSAADHGAHPAENPIWVSRRIAQLGWTEVSREIVSTALTRDQASRRPRLESELQREAARAEFAAATAEIRRLQSELQQARTGSPETSMADEELDAIFDAQNETISKLEAELNEALERNLELEVQLAESEATRESLQLALAHHEWARSDAEIGSRVAIVDETVDAAIERMADPTGALVCTEAALRGWREARYPDPDRMLDALRRLESAAIEWRANDAEIGERLGDWIQNTTGLRYAGSDQELERRGLATFHFEGRKMSRIPHIKVDDGKHSNQVGRIYFAVDSTKRRWVIDHIGQKLYGR